MFEILMIIAAIVAMVRIADAENRSGWAWGGITLALCVACAVVIPLPMVRIGIGFVLAFLCMFGAKVAATR